MRRRKSAKKLILWIVATAILSILALIAIYGFTHDAIDNAAWNNRKLKQNIEADTISPGAIFDSSGIKDIVLINEETKNAIKRLSAHFSIDSIATGENTSDVNYLLSKNGETQIILQNSSTGRISAIFIVGGDYFTDCGIGVGSTFASVFSAYPDAEMRLGEAEDGINGSSELCKVAPGILLLKWLDESATPRVACYNDNGIMLKLSDNYGLNRIDEIIITHAIWGD